MAQIVRMNGRVNELRTYLDLCSPTRRRYLDFYGAALTVTPTKLDPTM